MSAPSAPASGAPPAAAPAPPPPIVRRKGGRGVWVAVGIVVIIVILVGVGFTTSWYGLQKSSSSSPPGACTSGVTLQGQGASFLNALISTWKTSYTTTTSNQVDYTSNSAGQGISALADKLADFAATDEPMNASDVASMPGTTYTLPVTGGPVVVVYNLPSYPHQLKLTPAQIAGIYNGTITNWNSSALATNNPGLPTDQITTVHRIDQAGTTYVLTNLLSIYSPWWKSNIGTTVLPAKWPTTPSSQGEKGNSALAKFVAATPYTIGYIDLPDAVNDHLAPGAAILNPAGAYVGASVANTSSAINSLAGQTIPSPSGNWSSVSWVNAPGATDYPLATLSYFVVFQDPHVGYTSSLANAQVLRQWLHWVLTTGQGLSAGVDYVNPPANIVSQDLNALNSMVYDGASIPACT
jgi:phosphate transport system substrate-binding protein